MTRLIPILFVLVSLAFAQKPFMFTALGDMPYTLPDDYPKFERLIGAINNTPTAFSVHVGDIKSGSTPCSDENFQKIADYFKTFKAPLIYTPGDNEWTDCHREQAGKFDPLERLAKVRQMFFPAARSQGATPMAVERQSDQIPENQRWTMEGVVFATLHIVGSNNGFERTPASAAEFFGRDAADVAWIKDTFAKAANAPAIVFAFQADMSFNAAAYASGSGFVNVLNALADGAEAFKKPVLLIHGDSHVLVIDNPLSKAGKVLTNVTRLMVMGESQVHAVQVMVDPADPAVFAFKPLIVPANR